MRRDARPEVSLASAVSGEQAEAAAIERAQDAEVALVEGEQCARAVAIGEDDQ